MPYQAWSKASLQWALQTCGEGAASWSENATQWSLVLLWKGTPSIEVSSIYDHSPKIDSQIKRKNSLPMLLKHNFLGLQCVSKKTIHLSLFACNFIDH